MDLNNLRTGEKLLGISGIVLVVSLFLSWWKLDLGLGALAEGLGIDTSAIDIDTSINAWQASSFNDIVWFVTGGIAIALAVMAARRTTIESPVAPSAVITGLGALSLLLIIIRLIDPPYDLSRDYGVFIGLLGIIGVTVGGWLTMQDEGVGSSTLLGDSDPGASSVAAAPVAAPAPPAAPAPAAPIEEAPEEAVYVEEIEVVEVVEIDEPVEPAASDWTDAPAEADEPSEEDRPPLV